MLPKNRIVIEGITKEGHRFRPSDWAERISGHLVTVRNHRIHYSPLLQPGINEDGNKCVKIDPSLEQANPNLFNSILEFARKNNLNICEENDKS